MTQMKILVITPMDSERDLFEKTLKIKQTKHSYSTLKTGIGKVAAASKLAITLQKDKFDLVFVIGFAAASAHYKQGELVVPSKCIQHDVIIPEELHFLAPNMVKAYPLVGNDDCLVLTGDTFIDQTKAKELELRYPQKLVYDMEAAAITQVCEDFKIPVLVAKIISDIPSEGNNSEEFSKFVNSTTDFKNILNVSENINL